MTYTFDQIAKAFPQTMPGLLGSIDRAPPAIRSIEAPSPYLTFPNYGVQVEETVAQIRAGDNWHNNMLRLVGYRIALGWSDDDILLEAETMTLSGYTVADTRREVAQMIAGGRKKWTKPNPEPHIDATEPIVLPCMRAADWLNRDLPSPDFLLGDWLSTTTRALLTAATGIGKTMFSLDLAVAVACGSYFLHWKGRRPARVLLVDGEMSRRLMKQRIFESIRRSGMDTPDGLFILSREDVETLAPLNTPQGQQFIDHIIDEIGGIDLIVLDNVMSLLVGDMKEEQPWTDTLPWIRKLTQRSVGQIWVHHSGLDTSRGYGSSTREWQLDTVLHLDAFQRPDTDVSFDLSFRKARERTPDTRDDFADVRIALVNDDWAFQVTGNIRKGKKPSPKAYIFFEALNDALVSHSQRHHGRPSVTQDQWQSECVRRGLIDKDSKPNSARSLFSKYRLELLGDGMIACDGDLVWIVR